MQVYLVGGAIRDKLLDLPVRERDWVVVGATPDEMQAAGYRPVAGDFPVFLHPQTGEEYALARREVKTGPGYRGFRVETGPGVTLEQDLARRDLTINAMAEDARGILIDPHGGRADLAAGLLRHVTPAFVEDPVRLLRLARFAAKLGCRGFRVAPPTQGLLRAMVAGGEIAYLQPQRVWQELRKALAEATPWRFFEVLQQCGALDLLFPELLQTMAAPPRHGVGSNTASQPALRRAVAAGLGVEARFASVFAPVLTDAAAGLALCQRRRVDRPCRDLLLRALNLCPVVPAAAAAPAASVAWLGSARAWQQPERLRELLAVCAVLEPSSSTAARRIALAWEVAATVTTADLAAGLPGEAIRDALAQRRAAAIQEAWQGLGAG